MALKIDRRITAKQLLPKIQKLFELSAPKLVSLQKSWNPARGTPVFTVRGKYTSRSWTEWTQGFQFGSALLQFNATGDELFLACGWRDTVDHMATHVSHVGVHDHGFNNVSTYGNLWRMMREGQMAAEPHRMEFCELALKLSGAVQAARWTRLGEGQGYIYSFNGTHSLFVDTIRSLRSLAIAHQLGHVLMGERDRQISLLERLLQHAQATARYNIFYGEKRDAYDIAGRTAHEAIFNTSDGSYRCPNTQQGYSPFSTWTRGLAWAVLGFSEQLEFLKTVSLPAEGFIADFVRAARVTADFFIQNACTDGIPVWDTGAPSLWKLGNYSNKPSDPFNAWEPVDSSAAAIAAQGLLRLGNYLSAEHPKAASHYRQAGLTVTSTLLDEPYLSTSPAHQGLLLHSVYHRPNGWDYIAPKQKVPNGESSMWGDYHLRELALLVQREATCGVYPTFFDPALKSGASG